MKHIITLIIGDHGVDGHGRSDRINIRSNLDKNEMDKAYKAGTKKVGFNLRDDVAHDYEDGQIDNRKWAKLKKLGYDTDNSDAAEDEKLDEEDTISLWPESFADIYLFIVKLGNDKFEYENLDREQNPEIYIGGYGLFY